MFPPSQELKVTNQSQTLHELFGESTVTVRRCLDDLQAIRYAYHESPTDFNRGRVEAAKRDYLNAVQERESILEELTELESETCDPW